MGTPGAGTPDVGTPRAGTADAGTPGRPAPVVARPERGVRLVVALLTTIVLVFFMRRVAGDGPHLLDGTVP